MKWSTLKDGFQSATVKERFPVPEDHDAHQTLQHLRHLKPSDHRLDPWQYHDKGQQ